jgi:hypothetical protein
VWRSKERKTTINVKSEKMKTKTRENEKWGRKQQKWWYFSVRGVVWLSYKVNVWINKHSIHILEIARVAYQGDNDSYPLIAKSYK